MTETLAIRDSHKTLYNHKNHVSVLFQMSEQLTCVYVCIIGFCDLASFCCALFPYTILYHVNTV